jgi:cytochrome c oxidase subunit II
MFQTGLRQFLKRSLQPAMGLCAGATSLAALAESGDTLARAVTPITQRVFQLHSALLPAAGAIFVLVAGAILFAAVRYRRARGGKPARFYDNLRFEIAIVILAFLLVAGAAIPSTLILLQASDTSRVDMVVKITAYQGRWRYDYVDTDIGFFSAPVTPRDQVENRAPKGEFYLREVDHPLVLPAGRKLRFVITSADVGHTWWVPALGVGKRAVPGFLGEFWVQVQEPGIYRGHCGEYCGSDHAFTPIVVSVLAPDDFDKWLAEQKGRAAAAREGGSRAP